MDMNEFDLLLADRLGVIRDTINKYGEENFYLSFSGGKDSTIVHYLLDMALPNNSIPRVFIDTGIEYVDIRKFVLGLAEQDKRFVILRPTTPIKKVLEEYGYPFKSKDHSLKVGYYQAGSRCKSIMAYKENVGGRFGCPASLLYQYDDSFKLRLSNKCCYKLKKDVAHEYEVSSGRRIHITGIRMAEGGQRANHHGCLSFNGKDLVTFKPLNPIGDDWEDTFLYYYEIKLCRLYYPPFNFKRTGCKGCPYALDLQEQLTLMEIYLPNERKQCEMIWGKVYAEYRRIGFRLAKKEQLRLF